MPGLLPANMRQTHSGQGLYPATVPQTIESSVNDPSLWPQKWTLALTFEENDFKKGCDRAREIFKAVVDNAEGSLEHDSENYLSLASTLRMNQGIDPLSSFGDYRWTCPVAAKKTEGGKSFATSFATSNAPDWLKKTASVAVTGLEYAASLAGSVLEGGKKVAGVAAGVAGVGLTLGAGLMAYDYLSGVDPAVTRAQMGSVVGSTVGSIGSVWSKYAGGWGIGGSKA